MNWIEKMIAEQCPNGVERVKLISISNILYGCPFNATLFTEDSQYIPLIRIRDILSGKPSTYYTGDYEDKYIIRKNDILVGMDGNFNLGRWNSRDAVLCQRTLKIEAKTEEVVLNNYLYHYLGPVFKMIEEQTPGGSVKHLSAKAINSIEIPLPSLSIQEEIVSVLDKFSELIEKTDEEIALRQKQYEYYREKLLTFEEGLYQKIGNITRVFSASRVHKHEWQSSGVPFWRSSDVMSYYKGEENNRGKAYISYELYEELSAKSGKIHKDDLLVTGGGSIGIPYIVPNDEPLYVKDADLLCITKNNLLSTRFLYHFMLSNEFRDYLKKITHDASIAHYTISQIKETPIPVPSLSRQQEIVETLDKFEALIASLKEERELRQKQYEYYREKLLTF